MAIMLLIAILFRISIYAPLVACTPLHPHDPTITSPALLKRDTDPEFIGYYSITSNSKIVFSSAFASSGYAPFTTNEEVAWCPTTIADWRQACASSSLYTSCSGDVLHARGRSSSCAGSSTCDFNVIYVSLTSDDYDSLRMYTCMTTTWEVYYREDPRTDTVFSTYPFFSSSTPSPTRTSSDSTSTHKNDSTPGASPADSNSTPASTSTDTPPPPQPAKSKAWIAGPVIGSLAAIAIAGLVFVLIRRRRSNQEQTYQVAPQTSALSPQPQRGSFITPLPPPGVYEEGKGSSVSQTTGVGSNTYSVYSVNGSAMGPAEMNDLPEFVGSGRK